MNAEETDEKKKLSGVISKEVLELRLKALQTIRFLIQQDDLVGVKLFKLKIISNLLQHTLVASPLSLH